MCEFQAKLWSVPFNTFYQIIFSFNQGAVVFSFHRFIYLSSISSKTYDHIFIFQAAAQQAQANAAAAAAKAAAAGLGGQHKDSSNEGTAPEEYKVAPQSPEQESQEYYTHQSDYHH